MTKVRSPAAKQARTTALLELARRVDPARADVVQAELGAAFGASVAFGAAVLLSTCFPDQHRALLARPEAVRAVLEGNLAPARTRQQYLELAAKACPEHLDEAGFRSALRLFARRERARIALRELLPGALGGADIDVTARELAHLADATIECALGEAIRWGERRFGRAVVMEESGTTRAARFVVLGMGKLGGEELNAGSDVDLIYFYDSDEGGVVPPGAEATASGPDATTLHDLWQRVARRLTGSLSDLTEDGQVWRVDLRLRPEGSAGPLVNSIAAAERYYESFGRLWERAALLRARPVAGDLGLGATLLEDLTPFVWRKRIDPSIALELNQLVRRARVEGKGTLTAGGGPPIDGSVDLERDLKLGPGGIREAEFFVQTLQLVWGGRDPSLRERPTLAALAQLEAKGLCTGREAKDISDGYLLLRRTEHAVQFASGVQTHSLPGGEELLRLARTLGFEHGDALALELARHRQRIARRFSSLLPEKPSATPRWAHLLAAIELGDREGLISLLGRPSSQPPPAPTEASFDLERSSSRPVVDSDEGALALASNLIELAAHPDAVLGVRTREAFPGLAETLLDALFEAADPTQAARYLRFFFARVKQLAVYVRLVAADPAALRRLIAVVGASAFVGDALCNNPELGDMILFSKERVSPASARREVEDSAARPSGVDEDPDEAFVGALRLAKSRVTLEVALQHLAGAFGSRDVTLTLSELADASLEVSLARAVAGTSARGLAVIAMGKLGGRELSFGSDLDVVFVFDPEAAPDPIDAVSHFTKLARKVIRYISTFHGAGPGYELDTRLRPSGNQGLLVTSLDAFARYHGLQPDAAPRRAAVWERMALTRARFAAGDEALGTRALRLIAQAAFGPPPDREEAAAEMRRIRARIETELAREREGTFDLKLGYGGLVDVEFVVQFLQIVNGPSLDERAKRPETARALEALIDAGLIDADDGRALSDAYEFLRGLELKLRVLRADASHVLDTRGPLLEPLARRMGLRDHPTRSASATLLRRYREVTREVRAIWSRVFGAEGASS